ncbi:hypothetical protein SAMN05444172_8986 [Burkholderia sp. GAS332]|nr:hypothetical protein SAMN05444172_8986 [Burkholderia sp. GAS332]
MKCLALIVALSFAGSVYGVPLAQQKRDARAAVIDMNALYAMANRAAADGDRRRYDQEVVKGLHALSNRWAGKMAKWDGPLRPCLRAQDYLGLYIGSLDVQRFSVNPPLSIQADLTRQRKGYFRHRHLCAASAHQ